MAAPHVDNPFGAKPDSGGETSATDVNKNKGGNKDGNKDNKDKNAKDNKGVGAPVDNGPKCAHPYCNEPSDPSDYPIGLPWASGLLKCLPGYCKKHRKEAMDNVLDGVEEEQEEDEEEEDGSGGKKIKNVCKCKEDTSIICTHTPEDKPPYKKYIYADDPTVGQELCFFLRMMMVGDELDKWEEEERKAEKEAAKKRREQKKKRDEKKNKGKGTADKGDKGGKKGKTGKNVKVKGKTDEGNKSGSDPKISKEKSKSSQKVNEAAPAQGGEAAPASEEPEEERVDDEGVGPDPEA